MKKIILISILIIFSNSIWSQDVTGTWNGELKVQGMQLRLIFHIFNDNGNYTATMDSPDQGAKDIKMSKTSFDNGQLNIKFDAAQINYSGALIGDSIIGTFKQGGMTLPLNLFRNEIKKVELKRPQNPSLPYPYYYEDVYFTNKKDSIVLAGTLTLPKKEGKFPVVVLISGSGPQNRDEELMGHKPFLVLADYLTRNGIGVLRFDDRGTNLSQGDFSNATSFDFANDVEAAVEYLKLDQHVDIKNIGLIGHSEGGIIAPIVAERNKSVAFIVLMAGTGIPGNELLLRQQELIAKSMGTNESVIKSSLKINNAIFDLVKSYKNQDTLRTKIRNYLNSSTEVSQLLNNQAKSTEELINAQVKQITTPWMLNFIQYNPALILEKTQCPLLAINGNKDLQVPSNENLTAIEKALKKGGNKNFTIKELNGLNHLFQECKTGLPNEYAKIEQTISPVALETIMEWVKKTIK